MNKSIAIVGRGISVPGANSVASFWSNIVASQVSSIVDMDMRWNGKADKYYVQGNEPTSFGETYLRKGFCLPPEFDPLEGVEVFAEQVVGQVIDELNDYGDATKLERCGIVLGNTWSGESELVADAARFRHESDQVKAKEGLSISHARVLDHLKSRFGLGGPSLIVDAACASGLHIMKVGMDLIESGSSDIVLVGGLHTIMDPFLFSSLCGLGVLSRDGRMAPFANEASGFVPGEGMGMIALMRVDSAISQRKRIFGIIKGLGISSDGKSGSLISPSVEGQLLSYKRAYAGCEFPASEIDYLEAHGTATVLGDKTELESLTDFFSETVVDQRKIPFGSVKSLVGHCLPASGVISVIKSLCMLEHKQIPAHGERFLPSTDVLKNSLFYLPELGSRVKTASRPMRVGINSFGLGGTNAHVVLEEYIAGESTCQFSGVDEVDIGESVAITGVSGVYGLHDILEILNNFEILDDVKTTDWDETRFGGRAFSEYVGSAYNSPQIVSRKGHYLPKKVPVDIEGLGMGPVQLSEFNPFQVLGLSMAKQALKWSESIESNCDELSRETSVYFVSDYGGDGSFQLYRKFSKFSNAETIDKAISANEILGALPNMSSGLISRQFNLGGGHLNFTGKTDAFRTVLMLAINELASGKRSRVVIGSGHLISRPESVSLVRNDKGILSEGISILVLSRLSDALESGTPVLATFSSISGSDDAETITQSQDFGQAENMAKVVNLLTLWRNQKSAGIAYKISVCEERVWELKPGKDLFEKIPHHVLADSKFKLKERSQLVLQFAEISRSGPSGQTKDDKFPIQGREAENGTIYSNYYEILSTSISDFYTAQARLLNWSMAKESGLKNQIELFSGIKPYARDVVLENIVIDDPNASAELIVDEGHPYFFDHPLDHVPGILLIEGIDQLVAGAVLQNFKTSRSDFFVSSLSLSFIAPCLKRGVTTLDCSQIDANEEEFRFLISAQQGQVELLRGEMILSKSSIAYEKIRDHDQKTIYEKVESSLIHKTDSDNTLIADWGHHNVENSSSSSCIAPPILSGHFLSRNHSPHYSITHVLEVVRQAFTYSAHTEHGIAINANMILRTLNIELQAPLPRGLPLLIVLCDETGDSVSDFLLAKQRAELFLGKNAVGNVTADNIIRTDVDFSQTKKSQK